MSGEPKEEGWGWRDYVALFIAALETILLPALVFILVVLLVLAYFAFFR